MKFSELNLDPRLQQSLEKIGFLETTPIQEACIPEILAKKDIAGLAQTGTGKTGAFLIPLIERIYSSLNTSSEKPAEKQALNFENWNAQSFILVLVPTRELADQIHENILSLTQFEPLRSVTVYGGTSYDKQTSMLRQGVHFVVATPGRLIDLYKEHIVDFKQVKALVIDEADRLFDMGFKDDMSFILSRIPRERQFLCFSATLNFDVLNMAYQFGAQPVEISLSRDQKKSDNVKDEIFHISQSEKYTYILSILKKYNPKQVIVFTNFKFQVERIVQFLNQNKVPAIGISSLLTQAQRNRVIDQFRSENESNLLVATDLAARGLDIVGVDLVINYDMPQDPANYIHRVGRTGRAGQSGLAFSLICDQDLESLKRVEDLTKTKIDAGWFEETELIQPVKQTFAPRSHSNSRNNQGHREQARENSRDRGRDNGPRDAGANRSSNRGPRNADRRPDLRERGPRATVQAGGVGSNPRPLNKNNSTHSAGATHAAVSGPRLSSAKPLEKRNMNPQNGGHPARKTSKRPEFKNVRRTEVRTGTRVPPTLMKKVKGFFKTLLKKNPAKKSI